MDNHCGKRSAARRQASAGRGYCRRAREVARAAIGSAMQRALLWRELGTGASRMPVSDGVKQAMLDFYERYSAGDVAAFAEQITEEEDALVIGTDGSQWAEGRDTWVSGYESVMDQMPGLQLRAGDRLTGHEDGPIGWAADQASIVLPDGSDVPVRITAVFRRERGGWKVVTAHLSIGVPDAKLTELLPLLLD
jgi:ketosteroid isomerase-like protein